MTPANDDRLNEPGQKGAGAGDDRGPLSPARPWRRVVAALLDLAILLGILAPILLWPSVDRMKTEGLERVLKESLDVPAVVALIASWVLYSAALTASPLRATLGKRLTGLRVFDPEGRRLTARAALLREVLKFPCLYLDFLSVRRDHVVNPPGGPRFSYEILSKTGVYRARDLREREARMT
jgi:uncharacterized RDD family membrane protein YckC